MRPTSPAPVDTLAILHGMRASYRRGCRCLSCKLANSRYVSGRHCAPKNSHLNDLPAAEAREHLLKLSAAGIGRLTVSDISGVGSRTLREIKTGKRDRIRPHTMRRIFLVTLNAVSLATIVPAGPTWTRIRSLLSECYTKAAIAQGLGLKKPMLRIRKDYIRAKTAIAMSRLYLRKMR